VTYYTALAGSAAIEEPVCAYNSAKSNIKYDKILNDHKDTSACMWLSR
jgi:hypothetical protein